MLAMNSAFQDNVTTLFLCYFLVLIIKCKIAYCQSVFYARIKNFFHGVGGSWIFEFDEDVSMHFLVI